MDSAQVQGKSHSQRQGTERERTEKKVGKRNHTPKLESELKEPGVPESREGAQEQQTQEQQTQEQQTQEQQTQVPLVKQVPHVILEKITSQISADYERIFSGVFNSVSGYKINWRSYGAVIILISIASLIFGFFLYLAVWTITDDIIIDIQRESGADPQLLRRSDDVTTLIRDVDFWFGYSLLAFPLCLYLLVFWTYTTMLYNARLAEIVKGMNPKRIERLFKLHMQKPNTREQIEELVDRTRSYQFIRQVARKKDIVGIAPDFRSETQREMEKLAYKEKTKTITELVEKLSLRIDGITLSGFFFALILLEVIVNVSFVLPAVQFGRLHTLHEDILNTSDSSFLSFWVIEWAVFGVFVYSFLNLMERVPRKDITPRYYLNTAIRYIFAIALSSLFFLIFYQGNLVYQAQSQSADLDMQVNQVTYGALAAIAFAIGMFPNTFFKVLLNFVSKRIGQGFSKEIALEQFFGLNPNEITRLWEEGVTNVDQLADCTVEELYKKTRFSPIRLKSIIGRALLCKYVYNNQVDQVKHSPFPDIQSLCSYFLKKSLMDLKEEDDLNSLINSLYNEGKIVTIEDYHSSRNNYSKEVLYGVLFSAWTFRNQLKFTDTEAGIDELLSEELEDESSRPKAKTRDIILSSRARSSRNNFKRSTNVVNNAKSEPQTKQVGAIRTK